MSTKLSYSCPKEGLPKELQRELDLLPKTTFEKVCRIAYKALCFLLFPFYLLGLLLTYVTRSIALPATFLHSTSRLEAKERILNRGLAQEKGEAVWVETPDQASLSGAFLKGERADKCILFCNPNAVCFETIGELFITIAEKVGASACLFNPRGVSESKGIPTGVTLSVDVYSMLKFLIEEKGFAPEDILVYGYSLGGGYGLSGAALIEQEYKEASIPVCSDRSFSKLSDTAYYLLKETIGLSILGSAIGYLASKAVTLTGFEMDPQGALTTLKGKSLIISHPNDEIIRKDAQLRPIVNSTQLFLQPSSYYSFEHGRPFTEEEFPPIIEKLQEMLKITPKSKKRGFFSFFSREGR